MASVGGLVSGLDTATIISQLMRLEAIPQTQMKSRVSTQERQVTALQTLNSKLASIATRATELTSPSKWQPVKATSSSEHVTVKADATASPGSLSFTVNQTARAHQLSYANTAAMTDRVTAADSTVVRLDYLDGTTLDIDTGDGTLQGLVDAVNGADAGVKASTVKLDDGTYRLRVESTTTGKASDFKLTNADGSDLLGGTTNADGTSRVIAGRDAAVTVGTDTLTSATNTFTGVVAGVDFTLSASTPENTSVDLTITRDTKSVADKVKAMVDAVNSALGDIESLTAYDAASGKGGLLTGNSTVRSIRNELLSSVTAGIDGTSLASVGIEVDRHGKVTFDSAKFTDAYNADPTGTAAKFTGKLSFSDGGGSTGSVELHKGSWRTAPGTYTINANAEGGTIDGAAGTLSGSILTGADGTRVDGLQVRYDGEVNGTITYTQGFAAKLEALAQRASNSTSGTVTAAINGRNDRIDRLEDDIADWDVRLDLRRTSLERTYSALEVALGKMQNQSSWLASQIAGLPKMMSS
jgi:flagellar hook-associated protein 2